MAVKRGKFWDSNQSSNREGLIVLLSEEGQVITWSRSRSRSRRRRGKVKWSYPSSRRGYYGSSMVCLEVKI